MTTGEIIAAFIGVISVIVTIYVYLKTRKVKKLEYSILTNTDLLKIEDQVKRDIKITYKGKEVSEELSMILIQFTSAGNEEITEDDFSSDITINTLESSELVSKQIANVHPSSLKPVIVQNQLNSISIEPLLLNPEDLFIIRLIVLDNDGSIQINGRIKGVKEIVNKDISKKELDKKILLRVILPLYLVSVLFMIIGVIFKESSGKNFGIYGIIGFMVIMILQGITDFIVKRI